MFPDMYLQYNHPTIKSQQKPFDKNRQNLIPLHPPQRRCPHPPGTPQGNSAPAAIQRSADGSPTPVRPPRPHTPQKTERTDCQRDGCMVGTRCVGVSRWSYLAPGASDGKVLCGHKPQSKPHLSEPGTHQRTWRVMGRPARQKTQTLSMTRRNDRTRHDHAAAPLAVCPFVPPSIHPSHPHKKRAPRPKHPGTLPKPNNIISHSATSSAPSPTDPHAPSPSTYSPSLHSAPVQSLE